MFESIDQQDQPKRTAKPKRRWYRRRLFLIPFFCAMVAGAVLLFVVHRAVQRAQPILRDHVIDALSDRFQSPVELDSLDVSVLHGLEVSGAGLRILSINAAANPASNQRETPMLAIDRFHFHLGIRDLFRHTVHITTVRLEGMNLNLPPGKHVSMQHSGKKGKPYTFLIDRIVCADTVLTLETSKPGKVPLEFDIHNLTLTDVGPGQPFRYDATLVNPKPVGDIHATGTFGPWNSDEPRETQVTGDYSFNNADLNTTKGIAGILSSTGRFTGPLERLTVDGETDTPDFSIDIANRPVPLHTKFHAIVDGTNGDTTLQPVEARLGHSDFTAAGTIKLVKQDGHSVGHDIDLNVTMDGARIEDMLALGVKTWPPLMRGALAMRTHLHIPPGDASVSQKLQLQGSFTIHNALFSNQHIQDKVDMLSMRAQGEAKKANPQDADTVRSSMGGHFVLGNASLGITGLHYQLPGAKVLLDGTYSLDGNTFDFHGDVLTDAKISQMTTGWKSFLLKAVDPFFHKDGVGAKIPVKITGTKSDPHFGLDLGHKDEKREQRKPQQDEKLSAAEAQQKAQPATRHATPAGQPKQDKQKPSQQK